MLLTLAGNNQEKGFNAEKINSDSGIVMLIPHDKTMIASSRLNKSDSSGEVLVNITALAKNLPEPVEHQLKIVFDGSRPPTIVR